MITEASFWPSFFLSVFIGFMGGYVLRGMMKSKHKDRTRNIPGNPLEMKKRLLDTAGSPFQNFSPIDAIHQHLAGFHCYCGAANRQVQSFVYAII
jgi:hypothetical protein